MEAGIIVISCQMHGNPKSPDLVRHTLGSSFHLHSSKSSSGSSKSIRRSQLNPVIHNFISFKIILRLDFTLKRKLDLLIVKGPRIILLSKPESTDESVPCFDFTEESVNAPGEHNL